MLFSFSTGSWEVFHKQSVFIVFQLQQENAPYKNKKKHISATKHIDIEAALLTWFKDASAKKYELVFQFSKK